MGPYDHRCPVCGARSSGMAYPHDGFHLCLDLGERAFKMADNKDLLKLSLRREYEKAIRFLNAGPRTMIFKGRHLFRIRDRRMGNATKRIDG